MKIKTVCVENFRGICNEKLQFDAQSIVLFGINGAGKSSILKSINLLFSNMINKIVNQRFKQGINLAVEDIAYGKPACKISMECELAGNIYTYERSMHRKDKKRTHSIKQLEEMCASFHKSFCENEESNMPLFVNYGVHRLVLDIPLRIRTKHEFDKLSAFEKSINNTIDFRTFFEWFRYQEDLENQRKVDQRNLEYHDRALSATRKAITTMLEGTRNLRVDRHPLTMKVDKNGMSLNVDQLSDGEKCTLALLGDLTRRLALANPSLEDPLQGEGVVLIDEIELHMHPQWQRRIIGVLKKVFPNIQFIVTTHSPQVLGEIDDSFKVYKLENQNELVITEYNRLDGWDSNDILETLMHTAYRNCKTNDEFSDIFRAIRLKDFDQAESQLNELREKINLNNPDFIKANAFIALGRRPK